MKKPFIAPVASIVALVWMLIFASLPAGAGQTAAGVPAMMVPEPVFQFSPLLEGQKVTHTFIVENRGNAVLNIPKIHPD